MLPVTNKYFWLVATNQVDTTSIMVAETQLHSGRLIGGKQLSPRQFPFVPYNLVSREDRLKCCRPVPL